MKYVSQDLRDMLRQERTLLLGVLVEAGVYIENTAKEITPKDTGTLRDSVSVRVSHSPRYPGLIATANAYNKKTGYNYAGIQHNNPEYHHNEPEQYHYLSDPVDQAADEIMGKL